MRSNCRLYMIQHGACNSPIWWHLAKALRKQKATRHAWTTVAMTRSVCIFLLAERLIISLVSTTIPKKMQDGFDEWTALEYLLYHLSFIIGFLYYHIRRQRFKPILALMRPSCKLEELCEASYLYLFGLSRYWPLLLFRVHNLWSLWKPFSENVSRWYLEWRLVWSWAMFIIPAI